MNISPVTSYQGFTIFGFLLLVVVFLMAAAGRMGKMVVAFLSVVLLSMVLLNWAKIEPLILKKG